MRVRIAIFLGYFLTSGAVLANQPELEDESFAAVPVGTTATKAAWVVLVSEGEKSKFPSIYYVVDDENYPYYSVADVGVVATNSLGRFSQVTATVTKKGKDKRPYTHLKILEVRPIGGPSK